MVDYSQINDVRLEDVSQEYTLQDVSNSKKTAPINNNDLVPHKLNSEVDYSKIKKIDNFQPTLSPIEGQNQYEINWIKNIGNVTKIEDNITPIEVLMSQEPDFMPNMYNVYFVLVDNGKDVVDVDLSKNIESVTYDSGRNALVTPFEQRWSLIGTRIDGIEFPQKKQSTGTIQFAGQTINKVVGRYERLTKLDLTIRLDQNMYVLDAFHALNADCWAAERKRKDFIENAPTHPLEGKNFYNFLGIAMRKVNGKGKMLDIVVEYDADYFTFSRYHDLMGTVGFGETDVQIVKSPTESFKTDRVQRYVFHDCRFLGRSSSIQFKNDSADPLSATFPFVYRKLAHITADGKY